MEQADRIKYIKELAKIERKYQYLYGIAHKLKNPNLVATLFKMESETRMLIRSLESGMKVSEKEIKNKVKGIQKYEPQLQAELMAEKELDKLVEEVEKAVYVYASTKDDVPSTLDPKLLSDFHRMGSDLNVLARSIQMRDIRDPKEIKKKISQFMEVVKKVEKAL